MELVIHFLIEGCESKCKSKSNSKKKIITTTAGLEPARAKPKRFQVFLLNRSDKLPKSCTNLTYRIINSKICFSSTNLYTDAFPSVKVIYDLKIAIAGSAFALF